jgi:DNA-binding transcriptional MerR regulator
LRIQIHELLRDNGFAFSEAQELAAKAVTRFNATRERIFQFGAVTLEITGGLRAKLIFAPRDHQTPARTVERIQAQQNIAIDQRAAEIRQRREADERRGNRW